MEEVLATGCSNVIISNSIVQKLRPSIIREGEI
jgi:hypothetical protein